MKKLKSDINCILDAYESEVKFLISESKDLMNRLNDIQTHENYFDILQEIEDIELRGSIINSCKDECIKEL
jgi:hypothetical protein